MPLERLVFRIHAIRRMLERNIPTDEVKEILRTGKVIENYPHDKPYPSYLILGRLLHRPIHVVAADNTPDGETVVITVYEPDLTQWDSKFERRKR